MRSPRKSLRAFMKKYPGDRLAADANYWLGETLFQRQRYRDAAEIFLERLDQARQVRRARRTRCCGSASRSRR